MFHRRCHPVGRFLRNISSKPLSPLHPLNTFRPRMNETDRRLPVYTTIVHDQEQIRTFRAYAWVNAFAFGSIFACGAALVAVSAAKHEDAVSRCMVSDEGMSECEWRQAIDGPARFFPLATSRFRRPTSKVNRTTARSTCLPRARQSVRPLLGPM